MEAPDNHLNKIERSQKFIKAQTEQSNRTGCCPRCRGAETVRPWAQYANGSPTKTLKITVQSDSWDICIKILPSTTTQEIMW